MSTRKGNSRAAKYERDGERRLKAERKRRQPVDRVDGRRGVARYQAWQDEQTLGRRSDERG
jgi:hypothetical protein